MSFHTWLFLHGCDGKIACEAQAIAELNGEYSELEENQAFVIGGYVDAALAGDEEELNQYESNDDFPIVI